MPDNDPDQAAYQDYLDQHAYQEYLSQHAAAKKPSINDQFPASANPVMQQLQSKPGDFQARLESGANTLTGGNLAPIEARAQQLGQYLTGQRGSYEANEQAQESRLKAQEASNPEATAQGKFGGTVLMGAAMPATGVLGSAAIGAGLGALQNPGNGSRAVNTAIGAGVGGALGGASQLAGYLAPKLMAQGAGLSKLRGIDEATKSDLAQSLIDQGVMGTKAGVQEQIAKNLPVLEEQLQSEASKIGSVDSTKVASKIAGLVDKYKAEGLIPAESEGPISEILSRAEDVASRGDVSGTQALQLKRIAEQNAYKVAPGEVKPGLYPKLGSTEGRAYADELAAQNPNIKDLLTDQRANILAQKGLGKQSVDLASLLSKPLPTTLVNTSLAQVLNGAKGVATPLIPAAVQKADQ